MFAHRKELYQVHSSASVFSLEGLSLHRHQCVSLTRRSSVTFALAFSDLVGFMIFRRLKGLFNEL